MKTINDYAELVKEKHALNKTIAPVETDLTDASREYHIGEQFIINGGLFKAKTEIAQHDALVLNTNYEPADNLTEQIKNAGGGTGTDPRLDVFENNIAPVETDETDASRAYQVGEQLILDNILYDVIAPISEHDVITTTGSGANIEPADPLSSQFQTLTNQVKDMNNVLGSKNLLPPAHTQTNAGVTYTVNDDGSITINGTRSSAGGIILNDEIVLKAEETYVYSIGNPFNLSNTAGSNIEGYNGSSWVSIGVNIYGAETIGEFTASNTYSKYRVKINANNGVVFSNLTIYPMICLKSIYDLDDTYEPYAKTNRQLTKEADGIWDNTMDNGAVNIFNNTLASQTYNGVVFTVNADKTIITTGTPSTGFSVTIGKIKPPIGTYKLTCSPSSSTENTYKTQIERNAGGSGNTWEETGDGFVLNQTNASDEWTINIRFAPEYAGTQLPSGLVFKPMISDPSLDLSYDDYVPYAMSNRELTEELSEDSANVTENGITASFRKWGKVCTVSFLGAFNANIAYDVAFLNIPSGFAPKDNYQMLSTNKPSSVQDRIVLNIGYNGTINVAGQNVASGDALRGSFTYITA